MKLQITDVAVIDVCFCGVHDRGSQRYSGVPMADDDSFDDDDENGSCIALYDFVGQ